MYVASSLPLLSSSIQPVPHGKLLSLGLSFPSVPIAILVYKSNGRSVDLPLVGDCR